MDTCLINGNCYDDGEDNPENPLETCNATLNTTVWTEITPVASTSAGSTPITIASTPGEFFTCLMNELQ